MECLVWLAGGWMVEKGMAKNCIFVIHCSPKTVDSEKYNLEENTYNKNIVVAYQNNVHLWRKTSINFT